MRSITELLKTKAHVWFYISEELKQDFYEEARLFGAEFTNGEVLTPKSISNIMGLDCKKTIGYVSYFIWYQSFFMESFDAIRIDYEKYRSGGMDYVITKPNITPVFIEKEGEL